MRSLTLACALAAALAGGTAVGPASAAKSDSCAHCHGTDGNSSSGAFPSLAGQTKDYLVTQIRAFKTGARKNAMMSPSVGVLSDKDVEEVAEYYTSQNMTRGSFKPDPALAAKGKQIADEAGCAACHQPGLKGLGEFPRIARQKYPYIVKQMKDYRDGVRINPVMSPLAKTFTDEQIEALANYISGL
jgi:cytochrome c553